MTVKLLLDPVLTAAEPSRCSTYIQFYTFVDRALKARQDVFFYWLVPDWVSEADMLWLPQDARVHYIRVPQHKDRTKEYVTLRDRMDMLLAFNGALWDFDVLVTVRTPLVPLMKMIMTSPKQVSHAWTKEVWLIEEMPMLPFKKSVATLHPVAQSLQTLSGHRAAERVFLMSYHEKAEIIKEARKYLVPTEVIALNDKIQEVVPAQRDEFRKKSELEYFVPGEEKPFCIAYVGRLASGDTNLDKIYSAMSNAWILRGDTVRMLVLTVSTGGAGTPPKHIEMQRAPREEFWRICKEDMHVVIVMHMEAGFSLSLIEPMMFGVPALVIKRPWATAMLGPDYPFYIQGELEAYTWMKLFYEDYAGQYARFEAWYDKHFEPMFKERFETDGLYDILLDNVDRFNREIPARFAEKMEGRKSNEIIVALLKRLGERTEFVLFDELRAMGEDGTLRSLDGKLEADDRLTRGLVWATAWNDYRTLLKTFYGWEDASATVGHMRKVGAAPAKAPTKALKIKKRAS